MDSLTYLMTNEVYAWKYVKLKNLFVGDAAMRGELEFFPGLVSIVKNCDKQERNSIELLKGGC